jgi:ubiquinone/menaquinone biosynthesis C-methylase UbiE
MQEPLKIFFRDRHWFDRPLTACQRVLDIGAGGMRRARHVKTMDIRPLPDTDWVHNADQYPWPLADNSFDYIILSNVIEHVSDLTPFVREVHRIGSPGAIVRVVTPHFSNPCSFADPTHKHAFSIHFLDFYCVPLFRYRRRSLYFREILWPTMAPLWANHLADFYEVYWAKFIPAWAIYCELEIIK